MIHNLVKISGKRKHFVMRDVSHYTEEQHSKRIDGVNGVAGRVNSRSRSKMISIGIFAGEEIIYSRGLDSCNGFILNASDLKLNNH